LTGNSFLISTVAVAASVTPLQAALAALRRGEPVLLYDSDGREGETDLVVASEHCTPETVRLLRTDGGGLLCTTVAPEHHRLLGLPFLADLLEEAAARHPVLAAMRANDLRYDPSRSSFGLTINSRRTFTGIPDADRALTIQELARFLAALDGEPAEQARAAFGSRFRAPGHVILLNGAEGGLAARQGHTELSLQLARMAGLVPSTTICEMLDPASGRALGKKEAQAYASSKGLVFLTGQDVLDAWMAQHPQAPQAIVASA
jgi:3,4-dihydroxy 2-butanone 4-phosphate synthase